MATKTKAKDPIDAVLSNIEKQMGNSGKKSPFVRFGSMEVSTIPSISFGLIDIDNASYCGGVPRGKMIEVFGPESSGKSLLSLFLIANAQKQGLECALLDVEQSFDPVWATRHGVNVDKLVFSNDFECGEQALEYAYRLCNSGAFGVVVVDSTAALTPKAELEGSLDDNARVGAQAQLMSRGCRKMVTACGQGNTTCVFINQVREKIGVMYGNPETTPGGKALKFYCHQRIRVAKSSQIKVKENGVDVVVGQISKITFVKNKVARPFGQCEFKIVFDQTALNPVVMLCNHLRTAKLVKVYKGLYNIPADVFGEKIDTGATTIPELADYFIKEEKVVPMLEKLIELNEDFPIEGGIDDAIMEMKTDASKIVSPTSAVSVKAAKIADADPAHEIDETKEEAPEEE
jgi:recombination protein RecA